MRAIFLFLALASASVASAIPAPALKALNTYMGAVPPYGPPLPIKQVCTQAAERSKLKVVAIIPIEEGTSRLEMEDRWEMARMTYFPNDIVNLKSVKSSAFYGQEYGNRIMVQSYVLAKRWGICVLKW